VVQNITYSQLLREISRISNYLKSIGAQKGDRVAIYMPNIPEAVMSMLACARIGLVHRHLSFLPIPSFLPSFVQGCIRAPILDYSLVWFLEDSVQRH